MKKKERLAVAMILVASLWPSLWADEVVQHYQAKIDQGIALAKQMAADPAVVKAVEAQNDKLPPGYEEMTLEKWVALADTDPFILAFTKNPAALALRSKKTEMISEAFVSDARGFKVAFLGKTTNWCHKSRPKHDQPMAGQVWQGRLEFDKSAGVMQIQISVPILKDDKPIGSLVIGLSLESLSSG